MAAQTKALAIYDSSFWKEEGLSGDVQSHRAPLVQTHDVSTIHNRGAALLGFLGTPPSTRLDNEAAPKASNREQLEDLVTLSGADPAQLGLQRWAFETETTVELDHEAQYCLPQYGKPPDFAGLWNYRLLVGPTKVAVEFSSCMEGALECAKDIFQMLST